nr:MAG TPA: hypothetical protein [Caudoviricetes sp.]
MVVAQSAITTRGFCRIINIHSSVADISVQNSPALLMMRRVTCTSICTSKPKIVILDNS